MYGGGTVDEPGGWMPAGRSTRKVAFPAGGDDTWEPYVINFYYASDFPAPVPSSPGKNVGWTDWTLR